MYYETKELKISSHALEIGMRVVRLDRPWIETNFLLQDFIIQSQDDIDDCIRQCKYVYIEAKLNRRNQKKGLSARSKPKNRTQTLKKNRPVPSRKTVYINKIAIEHEMSAAKSSYAFAKSTIKGIMDGIRIGRMLDMNQAREVVDNVVDSILRNNEALTWLTKLKEKDEYTAEHSLNVCILSVAFARYLGHEEQEIKKIGLGGFLHDIGKAKIPIEILNKPSRFNDAEFEIMKTHPKLGRDLLMSLPDAKHFSVDIAYNHHERIDGTGYPRGLVAHQIPYYAKIIALTDTYDAITSNRIYDTGRASMEALDIIYKCKGTQFDKELAIEFIKCIGIYPPGSIVEMTNGEVGLVLSHSAETKLRPRIILVLDENKKQCAQKVIDLQKGALDKGQQSYLIAHELPNGKYGVDVRDYIKKGIIFSKHGTSK